MRTRYFFVMATLLAILQFGLAGPAWGLITGGEGNEPVNDPGWPTGAAEVFNAESRVAWWEGPPFGGGQWHAECRGDAAKFNKVLAAFAKVDAKTKRLVLHDGVGQSFWLGHNLKEKSADAAKIDWIFMTWQPASWERLRKLPADLAPRDAGEESPPAQIDVYTAGNIRWADVKVPEEVKVIDQRLEAHGFKLTDGVVMEGQVTDIATHKPLALATILLEQMESKADGYHYSVLKKVTTNEQGAWVIKNTPPGRYRLSAQADGYVARVIDYGFSDEQPRWKSYDISLSMPGKITGKVVDDAGEPLADAQVRLGDLKAAASRYEVVVEAKASTGADGTYVLENLPIGTASIWVHKAGYCCPGLGPAIAIPAKDLQLTMLKSAKLKVTVGFGAVKRPAGYVVRLEPAGGAGVGMWSGSGSINDANQIAFEDVPPGSYVLTGQPNPGGADEQTKPLAIELKSGQSLEIVLTAK